MDLIKIVYAITLDEFATDYECDPMGNILIFDNYEEIANYCIANDINFETVNVYELEAEVD